LDLKFKALHIQKGSLLTGIHIVAVYIDFVTGLMSLMSNHGCRATIASSDDYNSPVVTHQLGRTEVTSSTQQSSKTICNQSKSSRDLHAELDIVSVPISLDMDHIILGSSGLWCALVRTCGFLSHDHSYSNVIFSSLTRIACILLVYFGGIVQSV
jgi:hypothetical protein